MKTTEPGLNTASEINEGQFWTQWLQCGGYFIAAPTRALTLWMMNTQQARTGEAVSLRGAGGRSVIMSVGRQRVEPDYFPILQLQFPWHYTLLSSLNEKTWIRENFKRPSEMWQTCHAHTSQLKPRWCHTIRLSPIEAQSGITRQDRPVLACEQANFSKNLCNTRYLCLLHNVRIVTSSQSVDDFNSFLNVLSLNSYRHT